MTTAIASHTTSRDLEVLLRDARRTLENYSENPSDASACEAVYELRRQVARAFLGLPGSGVKNAELDAAEALIVLFSRSGAADFLPSSEDMGLVQEHAKHGWQGLLAAMILVPSFEWNDSPKYEAVPTWMWPSFTTYVFYTPQGFTSIGQAERYADHYVRRLEELAHWGAVNRGAAAVRLSLEGYLSRSNCIPLYFSRQSLKKHYELRARILSIALGVPTQADLLPIPRDGRRLRIGFINRHFGPQTETYTTLPSFEQLDSERFEVLLFANTESYTPVEEHARRAAASFQVLPTSVAEQVQMLLDANLDVAVFGTNLTAVPNETVRLALYRIAPLQVVNNSSCTTTGFPQIDLYVSGSATESVNAPQHFTERLGLLPGPAHAFNYTADHQEPDSAWTREALGIPENALVFVTAANYFKIIPEMQHAWAKLLAAVPESRLLVHPFNPNWSSSYPIKRFCAEFDRVLALHGVSGDRLVVSSNKFPSRTDVRELIRMGDVYLDTFPFGGVNSLIDPLECGIPVVTQEGETFRSRMGAAVLRSLGLQELVAVDEASYHKLALKLAEDSSWRSMLRAQIEEKMTRMPLVLDTLAASEAFGALMEKAFDELVAVGRKDFRRNPKPLSVTCATEIDAVESALALGMSGQAAELSRCILGADPANPRVRQFYGRALMQLGRPERAATYLLDAIQHIDRDTQLWCDLSMAFMQSGKLAEALQSVQVCLGVDGKNVEAILLLGDIAERVGQLHEIGEAVDIAVAAAPDDPRVIALKQKVIAA